MEGFQVKVTLVGPIDSMVISSGSPWSEVDVDGDKDSKYGYDETPKSKDANLYHLTQSSLTGQDNIYMFTHYVPLPVPWYNSNP